MLKYKAATACVLACMIAITSLPSKVYAETYKFHVSRETDDIYSISGVDAVIKTEYCYEYSYGEDAIVTTNGYGGDIVFMSSGSECSIEGLYAKIDVDAGNYKVNITHEGDDWYEVDGTGMFIRTSLCLNLALGSFAILTINSSGYGEFITDGDECSVDGIYERLKLN